MKKTLLSLSILFSLIALAQDPITSFYSVGPGIPDWGQEMNNYFLVTSGTPIDHETAGPNIVWSFNDLNVVSQTWTTTFPAGEEVIADYPGTTAIVQTTTEEGNPTNYYIAEMEGTYFTGAQTSQLTLAYSNPALVGYFPMNYGNSYTDDVAGSFSANGIEGTFTGTTAVSVDAYGTLTVNEGFEGTLNVTRLRTFQDLTLFYMGLPMGTLTQTTYSYYSADADITSGPVFRSITTHINIVALGIDQTQNTLESYRSSVVLNADHVDSMAKTAIAPNPVQDVLHISGIAEIGNVTITDAMGRTVLQSQVNDIAISHLPAGVYHVALTTEGKNTALKMVKQ